MRQARRCSQRWLALAATQVRTYVRRTENDVEYRLGRLGQERHPGPPSSLPAVEAGRPVVDPLNGLPLAVLACTSPARCMLVQPTAMQSSDERQRDSPVPTGGLIRVWPTEVLGAAWASFCDLLRPAERRSSVWPFCRRRVWRRRLSLSFPIWLSGFGGSPRSPSGRRSGSAIAALLGRQLIWCFYSCFSSCFSSQFEPVLLLSL